MSADAPRFPAECARKFSPDRLLASGGFGSVWLATQKGLARPVAIKLLHAAILENPALVERFLNEARITAALTHPNIVFIIDHNVEEGIPWIAYEYLPGKSLRDILSAGGMPWPEAVRATIQVASALELAHAQGILHRDIKPENVLVAAPGHYKVTDFGIAKWTIGSEVHTKTGTIMGTPAYLPPEQFEGTPFGPPTDIWAIGVMLHELLTGQKPFDAEELMDLITKILTAPVPPVSSLVPGVPMALDGIVARAMEKKPAGRFASVAELREALERVARAATADAGVDGPRPGAAEPPAVPGGAGSPASTVASGVSGARTTRPMRVAAGQRRTGSVRRISSTVATPAPAPPARGWRGRMAAAVAGLILATVAGVVAVRGIAPADRGTAVASAGASAPSRAAASVAASSSVGVFDEKLAVTDLAGFTYAVSALAKELNATTAAVAKKDAIGLDDDYFDHGMLQAGESIGAARAGSRPKRALDVDREMLVQLATKGVRESMRNSARDAWRAFSKFRDRGLDPRVPYVYQFQFGANIGNYLWCLARLEDNAAEKNDEARIRQDLRNQIGRWGVGQQELARPMRSWIVPYLRGRVLQQEVEETLDASRWRQLRARAVAEFDEALALLGEPGDANGTHPTGKPECLLHVLWEKHVCLRGLGDRKKDERETEEQGRRVLRETGLPADEDERRACQDARNAARRHFPERTRSTGVSRAPGSSR
jgi:serine/threonine-protein kinase